MGNPSTTRQTSAGQPEDRQELAVTSFLALGDSFSEGVGDPLPDGSAYRGWADRAAEQIAAYSPGLRYANLAIRGKLLGQVIDEQLPAAVTMAPDLVSLAAGGNDLLRPKADPDALAPLIDDAVQRLTEAGSTVLLFTGFDPGPFMAFRLVRGKAAVFNGHLRVIARRRGCLLVDLWAMGVLTDPRVWAPDRLHLAPDGHRRVALRVCEVLGVPVTEDWREPLPPLAPPPDGYRAVPAWLSARRADARWFKEYGAPWIRRRLAGVSSGDGLAPKRPDLLPL